MDTEHTPILPVLDAAGLLRGKCGIQRARTPGRDLGCQQGPGTHGGESENTNPKEDDCGEAEVDVVIAELEDTGDVLRMCRVCER